MSPGQLLFPCGFLLWFCKGSTTKSFLGALFSSVLTEVQCLNAHVDLCCTAYKQSIIIMLCDQSYYRFEF